MSGRRGVLLGIALTSAGCEPNDAADFGESGEELGATERGMKEADCDVVIIGGGPGGTHSAYKLTTLHLAKGPVCLFEKSDHLGGRAGSNYDVGFSKQPYVNDGVAVKQSGQVGLGAYRMYTTQYTYELGQELAALGKPGQLSFLEQIAFSRLSGVKNRGYNPAFPEPNYFTYNNDGAATAFQDLYHSPITDDDVWTMLLCGPQVPRDPSGHPAYVAMTANIPGLAEMTALDYLEWVAANEISPQYGPEIADYVVDVWRFRGDFQVGADAVSYMDYTALDYAGGPTFYPIPSYQPYFAIMHAEIEKNGGRIHLGEKVLSVNRQGSGYVIETSREKGSGQGKGHGHGHLRRVTANHVVIATHHSALQANDPNVESGGMTGDVIEAITSQPAYQYVIATNSVQVTHQFGDGKNPASGWWHQDITFPEGPALLGPQLGPDDAPLRRSTNNILIAGDKLPGCKSANCDFSDTLFYNNTNELPLADYHDFINVSRTMYNDDSESVARWEALYAAGEALSKAGGNAAVNRQLLKSLRLMYPKVFNGNSATEPKILATQVQLHKPAWYFLKSGGLEAGFTNQSLFQWSINPLPGERVYLVGDSWRLDGSGWSDAAYKSSIYVLNEHFGANIDPLEIAPIQCADDGTIIFP
ncbi:FAD-dependent oxidoreductase [Nannocystis radixulma]|uniref:NAD(P)-binding protein n=1 Tax=Nannocystis radixulma TaxID=2995305 RepID=A0ABT5AYI7_9BACT|nr:FAD-dependent oxidoreductase [Nannocystis radixulma]MDC0666278.1 NAD(P)-binding protein [Nannocystis radixulma]